MRNFGAIALLAFTLAACTDGGTHDLGEATGASQVLQPEQEPNAGVANATPIVGTNVVLIGNNYPGSDADYYSFTAAADDRVYAATQTGFSVSSENTVLALIASDGTTILESDDDGGSYSSASSSIGGTVIPAAGTYYLRVTSTGQVRPYHLHFQLRSGTPDAEVENNDTNPMPLPASGWISGSLTTVVDTVDLYSVDLQAGDTVYASLDTDPERDTVEFDGVLEMVVDGVTLGSNDAGSSGPDADAMFLTVKEAGTYTIRVTQASLFGTYHLSVSVHEASGVGCTTYTSTDVPVTIPTEGGPASSTIVVPDDIRVGDIDVTLELTHDFLEDFEAQLVAPGGNVVGLVTNVGEAGAAAMNVVIDDEAAVPIDTFTSTTGMFLQPEYQYRLHWFDGQPAQGTWTLEMFDDAAGDGGELTSWAITVCPPPPPPPCPVGSIPDVLFASDFEADDAGFTPAGEWERGLPSAAPITSCNSGASCWKTDLDGTYNASSSQDLVSPAIVLPGNVVAPIWVEWAQKYQMESASFDHAFVDVRRSDDTDPTRLFEFKDATMEHSVSTPSITVQESAGWGVHRGDLSAYEGESIELVFHVDGDGSVQYSGLAIDDVVVIGCRLQNVCGDNTVDPGEQCDDGNTVGDDGCSADCLSDETCGNDVADTTITPTPEVCDDGNNVDGDGCSADCLSDETCGNGTEDTAAGEVCDDGNTDPSDGCSANCLSDETCGNSVTDVTEGEQCDDGNTVGDDGCAADCLSDETCGNDVLDDTITPDPEVCDDGNTTGGDGCAADCLSDETCGNSIVDVGEQCDDGNTTPSDGCSADCSSDETCGNGVVDTSEGEQCDDGNTTGLDGCSADCLSNESCGNGVLDPGEDCDDGNLAGGDGCTAACELEICGNGIQDPGEECDDGNTESGDGCNATCTIDEGCGNGVVDEGELCDDGNTADGDGCSADCDSDETCGNGIEELDEQCDDGNTTDGDGCESDCTYPEPAPRCGDGTVDDGEECDDGNRTNGDSCSASCEIEPDGDRGCACNGGEGGEGNLLVLGLAGLAIFGTRRKKRAAA